MARECEECDGTGEVLVVCACVIDGAPDPNCPACDGFGDHNDVCPECFGEGEVDDDDDEVDP